jgi:ATP dependent DNA ligase domain
VRALPRALSLGNGNPRGLTPLQSCRQLCQFRSAIADHGPQPPPLLLEIGYRGRTRTGISSLHRRSRLPSGDLWLHEIKHDGFRVIARKDGDRVRLYSRPGNDITRRFPLIAEALTGLRSRSCIIDGEAVACDDNGLASFERIRYRQHDGDVFLYAFDLIELNGDDLRRDPLQVRKATLASIVASSRRSSSWSSTPRQPGCWALPCRRRYSPAPTR